MDRILKIQKRIKANTFLGVDALGRVYNVKTMNPLIVGQSVSLRNGIVVGVVKTVEHKTYEV